MLTIGDCFTLRNFGKPRLHIIVIEQNPDQDIGQVISVYLSSCENKRPEMIDNWTILNKGDHSFIDRKSFVKYQSALIYDKQWLSKNILDEYEPISTQILKSIQTAFDAKNGNPRIVKKYLHLFNEWHIDNLMANF
jgi:hypothetical protein